MNVLLTCAGRRNYLVEYFKQALGDTGRVFAADHSRLAPALQAADAAFIVPVVCDPDYIDRILAICIRHNVRLVISLNDLELPILAASKARFQREGIIVAVSDTKVINTCYDKWQAISFAANAGIAMPPTFLTLESARQALDAGKLKFPLVVKPRWGSASFAMEICDDFDELAYDYALTKKLLTQSPPPVGADDKENNVMIQAMLLGNEYGLDVVNDLDGRYVCTFSKQKYAMRAGETDKAIIVDHQALTDLGRKIGTCLGHVANLDCDVFGTDDGFYLIDMNPRFGGGYPFSHLAGANIPAALLSWAEGKTPDPVWLTVTPGVTAAKYDRLVVVKPVGELKA